MWAIPAVQSIRRKLIVKVAITQDGRDLRLESELMAAALERGIVIHEGRTRIDHACLHGGVDVLLMLEPTPQGVTVSGSRKRGCDAGHS